MINVGLLNGVHYNKTEHRSRGPVKNTFDVYETVIKAATELIEQHNGDAAKITSRAVAEKAGVGPELLNYHFGSKENLFAACVQRIISGVIMGFQAEKEYITDKARLAAWAGDVFEFPFTHPAVSKISVLGDLRQYTAGCHSVSTQKEASSALLQDIDAKDKPLLAFILTASMQAAFLGADTATAILGYAFTKQAGRTAYN